MALQATTKLNRRAASAKPAERDTPARMLTLIEAAEDIFLAKGYHAATMSDVAKAAGMSKKTIYTMVESKIDLFAELLTHYQSMLQFPLLEPDWTVRDKLVANLTAIARFLLSPEQIALVRLIMAEYTHSPDFGRIFHRSRLSKLKNQIEDCLSEFTRELGLSAAESKELSAMLFGMAISEFHLSVLVGFRSAPSRQVLEKRVRRAVDIFLAGCDK